MFLIFRLKKIKKSFKCLNINNICYIFGTEKDNTILCLTKLIIFIYEQDRSYQCDCSRIRPF